MKKLWLLSLLICFTACKKEFVLPHASGRPYEVMVVMKKYAWEAQEGRALFHVLDTDVPGLPQPERSFHISQVNPDRFDHILNIFRNIIIVDIDKTKYTKTSMRFVRDKYAIDQIVLTMTSPSPENFADFCFEHSQDIVDFLTKMEMNRLVKELETKHSKITAELAKKLFDCEFNAPDELKSSKKGKNFFWTSNNTAQGMESICMYSYPYEGPETFTKEYVLAKRDSVMHVNIPGPVKDSYITTDTLCTAVKPIVVHNQYAMEARGLWYTANYPMGGPFVSHSRVDTTRNLVIVVEGFVFAPEKMKRGFMRRLEGSLYTLNLPDEKTSKIVTTMDEVEIKPEKK